MRVLVKKSLILSLSIVGSIVGVGFITGKEILTFFCRYGSYSFLLCFIVSLLFGLFVYLITSRKVYINNIQINKKRKKYFKSAKNGIKTSNMLCFNAIFTFFDYILVICQISICSAMFAGFDLIFDFCGFSFVLIVIIKIMQ